MVCRMKMGGLDGRINRDNLWNKLDETIKMVRILRLVMPDRWRSMLRSR
jgi:hypothetical protein